MDGKRARSYSGTQPIADEVVFEHQRASGATLVSGPFAFSGERAVRDAHGRKVQHPSEVEGEAGSPRVVAAGGVDDEDVRRLRKCANGSFEQLALAQRQQTRFVGRAGIARHDDGLFA
jgi:hypothetical protein